MTKSSPLYVIEDARAVLAAELLDYPVLPRDMRHYPHVSYDVRRANAKFIGAAGEYLVDSLLTRHGLTVWSAPDLHRADRMIEIHGRAVLLQIKTVTAPVNGVCIFPMVHGNSRAGNKRPYDKGAFDIAALAVLSENVVKFVPNRGRSFHVDVTEFESLKADPIDSLEFSLGMMMKCASLPQC
jgi:hypothetical protein